MRLRWASMTALLLLSGNACQGGKPAASEPAQAPTAPQPTQAPPAQEPAPTSQPAQASEGEDEDFEDYEASEPKRLADGRAVYGGELDDKLELTALADIIAKPEAYADKRVKTQGQIKRVCKAMGCWMELDPGEGSPEVRAPMAGHSYFLPQAVIGKQATVEATVKVRELSEAQKKHFEAEGAKATELGISLEATAVAVR